MRSVCFVYPPSYHYRVPFHERLRDILMKHDIDYFVVYSELGKKNRFKNDTVDISWGKKVPLTRIGSGEYQHALISAWGCDLIIAQQENKLLVNYPLILASLFRLKKVAYFGHGRNFQSRNPNGLSERWKRFWTTKVNWWFGYTDETRRHVESLGFPAKQITVFNNSVDTSALRAQADAVTSERLIALRGELGLAGHYVGVFVGGIYADKRMAFLVAAADAIRTCIPDFELLVIGGGSDLPVVEALAQTRPWLRTLGPRFGQEKVELMQLGHVFMMPGLVGLAILDAGVMGLPVATTAFPWHSPEIAYLKPGHNGIIVEQWEDPAAYGEAIADLLLDRETREKMSAAARVTADAYSIERMAENFAQGVVKALTA